METVSNRLVVGIYFKDLFGGVYDSPDTIVEYLA